MLATSIELVGRRERSVPEFLHPSDVAALREQNAVQPEGLLAGGAKRGATLRPGIDCAALATLRVRNPRIFKEIVANIADLALWSGALLLVPVVRSLLVAIRAERLAKVSRGMQYSEA